jgi:hypothetical protein
MAVFTSVVHCAASHGEGEITGPRSAVAEYQFTGCVTEKGSNTKCKSEGASEEEIATGKIDAELVFIDQAKHEVGILLAPNGGTYIAFKCGGESAEGRGPFLAPVNPVNVEATAFTAILSRSESAQTPDEYETLTGEKVPAIPMGTHGSEPLVTTGVEATFTIHPSWPGEIKTITAEEVQAATTKKQEEEATPTAAAKRRQEEEVAAGAKKHQEEEAAAAKKHEEEKSKSKPTRAQLLTKALKACEKQPKKRRTRCVAGAHKKYGPKAKKKGQHK